MALYAPNSDLSPVGIADRVGTELNFQMMSRVVATFRESSAIPQLP